jgi:hypothetical protein
MQRIRKVISQLDTGTSHADVVGLKSIISTRLLRVGPIMLDRFAFLSLNSALLKLAVFCMA